MYTKNFDWDAAYRDHSPSLHRLAWLIVQNSADADEVVQVTFERAFRYRGSFDDGNPLRPWLTRIAVRAATRLARRRRLEQFVTLGHTGPEALESFEEQSVSALMVARALRDLGPRHRSVVALFYLEDLTIDEVASLLHIPRGTVGSRLHEARRRLRVILESEGRAGRPNNATV